MGGNGECSPATEGEWVRGKLVGSGSFGSVHLAMSKSTGGLFVVKSAKSGAGLKALENEANILDRLNCPHIVRCLGKGKEYCSMTQRKCNNNNIVFMEYMAGGSLCDVIKTLGGWLDEDVVRRYTKQILLALTYLHENGIAHCDVKCKNVLLGSSGNVKLADFGSAKKIIDSSSSSYIGGTPLWMAPEVLKNEGRRRPLNLFAADIWSLGCTVIEMATGRPPWGSFETLIINPMATLLKIACTNQTPQYPKHFSNQGLDFLNKCLERDPQTRWMAKDLLNHPFVLESFTKDYAPISSPASVLDINDDDHNSKFLFPKGIAAVLLHNKNPFSKLCDQRKWIDGFETNESYLESSSENWITVR